jgi:phosphoribosylaminoimidazolecarboxamide formyltransferase/IMP cyclohydrolase
MLEAGLTVMDVSEFTGFPEMLDGRVKTPIPAHGGLLGMRATGACGEDEHGIEPIDMVAEPYPFEATVAKEGHAGRRH